ncbi:hypothetical protein IEI_05245 [Bacillus wiedmannii]|nr:hypothetical protein IEI_05245 [Bacillus wiedmannii]
MTEVTTILSIAGIVIMSLARIYFILYRYVFRFCKSSIIRWEYCEDEKLHVFRLFVLLLNKKDSATQYRICNQTFLKAKLWFYITFIRFMFNEYSYILTSLVFTSSFIRKFILIQFGKFKSSTVFIISN